MQRLNSRVTVLFLAGLWLAMVSVAGQESAPPGGGKETYAGEIIMGQCLSAETLGPGRVTLGSISTDRIYSAKRKRLYWFQAEGANNGLFSYDPESGLKEMVAGCGGAGDLDGSRETWRGHTWHYQTSGIGLDDEKGIIYVLSSGKVKAISLDDGTSRTVADTGKLKALCFGSDGQVYTSGWTGVHRVDPASGKSMQLSTEPFPGKDKSPWGYMAADPKRGKLYGHSREDVGELDLKTGKFALLSGGGKSFAAGPFKEAAWWCPTGAQMTLDSRYLIVGGGDQQTYLRLDLDKQYRDMLLSTGKGADTRWTWGDVGNNKDPRVFPWPGSLAIDANTGDLYFGLPVWPAVGHLKRVK